MQKKTASIREQLMIKQKTNLQKYDIFFASPILTSKLI